MMIGRPIAIMGTGFGRTTAGLGRQVIPGDGRHFITAAGCIENTMDGFGCRIMNGDPRGSLGGQAPIIAGGRRFPREADSCATRVFSSELIG